jgi:hypothetical protein
MNDIGIHATPREVLLERAEARPHGIEGGVEKSTGDPTGWISLLKSCITAMPWLGNRLSTRPSCIGLGAKDANSQRGNR